MTITHGSYKKKLVLYPPAKPSSDIEDPLWVREEGDDPILTILTIDTTISLKEPEEDIMFSYFLQNIYNSPFLLGDIVILQN